MDSITGDYIDIITFHQYGPLLPGDKIAKIDSLKEIVDNLINHNGLSSKPLWCTETGWHTKPPDEGWGHPVPYDTQAIFYVEFLDSMLKRRNWFERTTFFALTFVEKNSDDPSQHHYWGIMEIDSANNALIPKPAYYAYKDYIKGTMSRIYGRGIRWRQLMRVAGSYITGGDYLGLTAL